MTSDELRDFVKRATWTFAKSMAETPHEYTLRKNAPDEMHFDQVVMYIRQHGDIKSFNRRCYTYLAIDGWQYWTMGSPLEQTILINRSKVP